MIDTSCPLIFMHVPKTAGMSLVAAMYDRWGNGVIDMYNMTDANPSAAGQALQNNKVFAYCGHFPFGLHRWIDRSTAYLSMVREPVDRILSFYNFAGVYRDRCSRFLEMADKAADQAIQRGQQLTNVMRIMKQVGAKLPAAGGMSYEDAMVWRQAALPDKFRIMDLPSYMDDFIPWITVDASFETFLECPSAELDNGMVRRFSGVGVQEGACPPESLDQAKTNIETYFSLVGVKEHYDETTRLIREVFDLPWLAERKKNVSSVVNRHPVEVSDVLRTRIAEKNRLDVELYEWVVDRFHKVLSRPPDELRRKVPGGNRTNYDQIRMWKGVGRMDAIG